VEVQQVAWVARAGLLAMCSFTEGLMLISHRAVLGGDAILDLFQCREGLPESLECFGSRSDTSGHYIHQIVHAFQEHALDTFA
jgi:hypothetical protein